MSHGRAYRFAVARIERAVEHQAQTLDLSWLQLEALPEQLGAVTSLQSLDLRGNRLREVPAGLVRLINLQSLNLSHNRLREVPEWLARLTSLQSLDLSYNRLREVPAWLATLGNLQALDLRGNWMSEIPEWLATLADLQSLDPTERVPRDTDLSMELLHRHEKLLGEICRAVAKQQPPWWNATARLGQPILGRSGQSLRGLPAVIAWHVGDQLGGDSLAWRLNPATKVELSRAAVFRLAGNGGDTLYAATRDRRPHEMVDSPTKAHLEYWPLERLGDRLDRIARRLGSLAPDFESDYWPILSLAQAFIRPLGDTREPTSVSLGRTWTHQRMAFVASWARVIADEVRLEIFADHGWSYGSRPEGQPEGQPEPAYFRVRSMADSLQHLCRAGWLQQCLPAEVRERCVVQQEEGTDWRHLVGEQPIRPGFFNTKRLLRAPALSRWLPRFSTWLPSSQLASWVMHNMKWRDKAAFGLALAANLGDRSFPSEPGLAWRSIGRQACSILQRKSYPESFAAALDFADARGYWEDMRAHHQLKTWFHPFSTTPLKALVASRRWAREDLEGLLEEQNRPSWDEGGSECPANALPVVKVATLRRSKRKMQGDEDVILALIARALGCKPRWEAVTDAAMGVAWQRRRRPKRTGGTRWLDVPSEPMRAAHRIVNRLLLWRAPGQGTPTAFHPGGSPALHARAHIGAKAAIRMDLANFFGCVRPWHVEPWLGLGSGRNRNLLPEWSGEGRRALMTLLFHDNQGTKYLPQGAPCSPSAANLAASWLDHAVIHRAVEAFGAGNFVFTRYADDMVLSTVQEYGADDFKHQAAQLLRDAVREQRWRVQSSKTRLWTYRDRQALHVCGIRVPVDSATPLTLDQDMGRRARAALHRLRHRIDFDRDTPGKPTVTHGLLAYCYSATGDLHWLAYTSRRLQTFAECFAGPLFSESFLAGWSDTGPVAKPLPDQ